jgi:hypothetical protein
MVYAKSPTNTASVLFDRECRCKGDERKKLTLEALLEHVTRTRPDTERVRHFEGLLFGSKERVRGTEREASVYKIPTICGWRDKAGRGLRGREWVQEKRVFFWDDGVSRVHCGRGFEVGHAYTCACVCVFV